jgi:adenosylcobyric acid synthase
LLALSTVLESAKQTRLLTASAAASFLDAAGSFQLSGYEIHHGRTSGHNEQQWTADDGSELGARRGRVWGTYLHGIFSNDDFRHAWLRSLGVSAAPISWSDHLEQELDRMADTVAAALDLGYIHSLLARQAA